MARGWRRFCGVQCLRRGAEQDGIALIAALMVLLVIGAIGAAVVRFSSTNTRSAEHSLSSSQARSLAEGGIDSAMAIIAQPTSNRADPNLVPQAVTSYADGDVTWSGSYDSTTATWKISSTAVVDNPTGAADISKTVTAKVWVAEITYASQQDPGDGTTDYEIWGMNSDGTGARPVTNNTVAERYPHWSSDGLSLVFSSELANDAVRGASSGSSGAAPNANRDIYTMNADGSNLTRLTTDAGTVNRKFSSDEEDPAWGPAGKIFFASLRNGHKGSGPSWSKSNLDLYIMDTDGSNQVDLTACQRSPDNYWTRPGGKCSNDQEPAYNGNGLVCLESNAQTGTTSVHAIPVTVDGSGNVTTGAPYDMINKPGRHLNCDFSTDGTKMVYSSDRDGDWEIFVLDLTTGTDTRMTFNNVEDRQPGWTIDGRIVFGSHMTTGAPNSNNPDGNRELFIMNADGTGLWQLTTTTGGSVNNWPNIRHDFRPYDYSG